MKDINSNPGYPKPPAPIQIKYGKTLGAGLVKGKDGKLKLPDRTKAK